MASSGHAPFNLITEIAVLARHPSSLVYYIVHMHTSGFHPEGGGLGDYTAERECAKINHALFDHANIVILWYNPKKGGPLSLPPSLSLSSTFPFEFGGGRKLPPPPHWMNSCTCRACPAGKKGSREVSNLQNIYQCQFAVYMHRELTHCY